MIRHQVSVVATVLNEYENVPAWLSALDLQTVQPLEYIIVDGGSDDGTWELLEGWLAPTRKILIRADGCSISEGRNLGIESSTGQFVATTDAGTTARSDWLKRITDPLLNSEVDVVSGFFVPFGDSLWQRTLAATTLPDACEIDNDEFLPSSRSIAFRRTWFEAGYRYPEWLDYCEDLVFDLQLKRSAARFVFAPAAVVRFKPRSNMRAYFVQYFRYARGDGKAGLFPQRHIIRYVSYSAMIIVLARRKPSELMLISVAGLISLNKPIRRLFRRRTIDQSFAALVLEVPIIACQRAAGDLAKMIGYLVGINWRLKRYGWGGIRINWGRIRSDGRQWQPQLLSTKTQHSKAPRDGESPRHLQL